MTYIVNVQGTMANLDDESTIEQKARDFVTSIDGVIVATLTTTHGGSVNLISTTEPAPGVSDGNAVVENTPPAPEPAPAPTEGNTTSEA